MTVIGDLAGITGSVLVPGDEQYAAQTALFNLHLALTPDIVVIPDDAADVQAAVRYAADRKMPIAVKNSGHQVVLPCEGGLLINTHRMAGVTVDPGRRTARVEAGTRWQEVLDAAEPHGLAPMPGSAPHIGVVGYTLGGGLSPVFGRSKGYAADHVVSIDVVAADGELRTATADDDPNLFWALRGCKGNFGVVTAIDIELFPVTHVYAGGLYLPGERSAEILHAWRTWVATLPEEATSSVAVMRLPDVPQMPEPLRGAFVLHLRFAFLGSTADGERLLTPMRAIAPALIDTVAEMPITQVGAIHNDPVDPAPYWDRVTTLRELPAEALDALLTAVGPDSGCELVSVEIRQLGGALAREAAVPNAVPSREARFCVFGIGIGPAEREAHLTAQLEGYVDTLKPWSSPHIIPNFLSPWEATTPEAVQDIYGAAKYERLLAVKAAYDPENLFRVNHNVRPLESGL
jgi:FAD/FMN-containing dehydrogenase